MKDDYKAKLPAEFVEVKKFLGKLGEDVFFQGLQSSGGMTGNYTSLDLVFLEDFQLKFANTGFDFKVLSKDLISGRKGSQNYTTANSTWKGHSIVHMGDYNPKNNVKNFFYFKYILNLTDEQLLAHFINNVDNFKNYNSQVSNLDIFISDIEKVNKIKIDKTKVESSNLQVKELCKQINAQMKDSDCGFAGYKTYIEDKDAKKTRQNIDRFFGNLGRYNLSTITDDYLLPRGKYTFADPELNVVLPNNFFYLKKKNDQSAINFYIEEVDYQLKYDFEKETFVLVVKLVPFRNTLSADFKFFSEFQSALKTKPSIEEISVEKENFKYLELYIYPEKMEAKVYLNNNKNQFSGSSYIQNFQLKNTFKFEKANKK